MRYKPQLVEAIVAEIGLRQAWPHRQIDTVYFGGGTPSLLTKHELGIIVEALYRHFDLSGVREVTLEANPDDLTDSYLTELGQLGFVNRLSIGVQSFHDAHLKVMNRAHNAGEALTCIDRARQHGFDNLTIDLMYGLADGRDDLWQANLQTAMLDLAVPHLSCYALTVEPNTPLAKQTPASALPAYEAAAARHMQMLMQAAQNAGFEHYEISNLAQPGRRAEHNSAYWQGKAYLGIGPAAHSYDGAAQRSWHPANNNQYISAVMAGRLPLTTETLTEAEQFNEWVMTGLRLLEGLSLASGRQRFGNQAVAELVSDSLPYVNEGLAVVDEYAIRLTSAGRLQADGIAADLFVG